MGKNRMHRIVLLAALLLSSACSSRTGGPLLSAPPSAAADNDVYVADADRIRALRPDGKEQWSYSLADDLVRLDNEASRDTRIDFLVARSGGKLFGLAMQESGRRAGRRILFALDGNRLIWHREVPYPSQGITPMAVGNDAVYEASEDGVLYAFSRTDGKPLWQYRVSGGPLGAPTVGADGTIYITGPRHNLHAVAPDGTSRWVIETQK
jgi:outer membrane protein assembly factor BamB